jgi:hypothetical protein
LSSSPSPPSLVVSRSNYHSSTVQEENWTEQTRFQTTFESLERREEMNERIDVGEENCNCKWTSNAIKSTRDMYCFSEEFVILTGLFARFAQETKQSKSMALEGI